MALALEAGVLVGPVVAVSVQTEAVITAATAESAEPAEPAGLAVAVAVGGPAVEAARLQVLAAMVALEEPVVLAVSVVAAVVVALAALVEWVTVVAVRRARPVLPVSVPPAGTVLSSWSFK